MYSYIKIYDHSLFITIYKNENKNLALTHIESFNKQLKAKIYFHCII